MLFRNTQIDSFAKRFERDDHGYIYRANLRSAGIRVSESERDTFVSTFNRRMMILRWGGPALMVALVIGGTSALLAWAPDSSIPQYAALLATVPMLLLFLAGFYWLWNAPTRALLGRQTTDEGRTKSEARETALSRLTWPQIGVSALFVALASARVAFGHNLLEGWNRLWLVLIVAGALGIARTAYRKWRFDSRARTAP